MVDRLSATAGFGNHETFVFRPTEFFVPGEASAGRLRRASPEAGWMCSRRALACGRLRIVAVGGQHLVEKCRRR